MRYNKLVRDNIPEIIRRNGETPVTRTLGKAEYRQALVDKLREEVDEFVQGGDAEELADILEVVYALAATQAVTPAALEQLRTQKWQARGGFDGRIHLVETKFLTTDT